MLLKKSQLTVEQVAVIDRLYEYDNTLLVAKMGGGKTVCSLTAMQELLEEGVCKRILVVAPLKVCKEVWAHEHKKWEHTVNMDIAVAAGASPHARADLMKDARIVVVNFENLAWVVKNKLAKGFDGLVLDELSRLKSSGGTNFKALRRLLPQFKWRVGMTGTPVSEDFIGLYGQALMVDGGRALGTRKDTYLNKYFYATDYNQYNWELRAGSAEKIMEALQNLVYVMPDYRGELKPIKYRTASLELPDLLRAQYEELKDTFVLGEEGNESLIVENAAVLVGKLQQIACGFYYEEYEGKRSVVELSDFRLRACVAEVKKLVESGRSVIVPYWFSRDCSSLRALFKEAGIEAKDVKEPNAVQAWNACKLQVLMLHPRSAGHGLNLADGGCDVLWYSLPWSNDLWEQTNGRLWRRGQTKQVTVHTLIVASSIDEVVLARLEEKENYEKLFLKHMKKGV